VKPGPLRTLARGSRPSSIGYKLRFTVSRFRGTIVVFFARVLLSFDSRWMGGRWGGSVFGYGRRDCGHDLIVSSQDVLICKSKWFQVLELGVMGVDGNGGSESGGASALDILRYRFSQSALTRGSKALHST
jgi:hypothetical protein